MQPCNNIETSPAYYLTNHMTTLKASLLYRLRVHKRFIERTHLPLFNQPISIKCLLSKNCAQVIATDKCLQGINLKFR